jgi:hypothetical protein
MIAALLVAINLSANIAGNAHFAGTSFISMMALMFVVRANVNDWFRGIFEMVIGLIISGYLIQICGEVLGDWVTSELFLSALLSAIIAVIMLTTNIEAPIKRMLSRFGLLASAGSALWLYLLSLTPATLVNFLGYGYDNAAHVAQVNLILENHGTTLLSGGLDKWPTFIQDMAQAGTSLVATLARFMGVSSSTPMLIITVFTYVTLLIPVIAILSPICGVLMNKPSAWLSLSLMILVFVTYGTGYLSRIWFSGYFSSNLGTLLLILIVTSIVMHSFDGPTAPLIAVLVMTHVYPLFAVIGGLIILPFLVRNVHRASRGKSGLRGAISLPQFVIIVGLALLLVLPIRATSRSYGGSQFLADGGIESLPIKFMIIWGVAFTVIPIMLIKRFDPDWTNFATTIVIAITALAIGLYSFAELSRITYYPTKLIIGLALAAIALVVCAVSQPKLPRNLPLAVPIALLAAIGYVIFQPESKVFKSAYMGEATEVIAASTEARTEVVQAGLNVELARIGEEYRSSILLMKMIGESELNSRWINTLSGTWNDESWTDWLTIRRLMEEAKWSQVSEALDETQTLIASDDPVVIENLQESNPGRVCTISSMNGCDFP